MDDSVDAWVALWELQVDLSGKREECPLAGLGILKDCKVQFAVQ